MRNKLTSLFAASLLVASFSTPGTCMENDLLHEPSVSKSRLANLAVFEQPDLEQAKTTLLGGTLTLDGILVEGFVHDGHLYQLLTEGATATQRSVIALIGRINENNEVSLSEKNKIIILHGSFVKIGFDTYGHPISQKYALLPQSLEEQVLFRLS